MVEGLGPDFFAGGHSPIPELAVASQRRIAIQDVSVSRALKPDGSSVHLVDGSDVFGRSDVFTPCSYAGGGLGRVPHPQFAEGLGIPVDGPAVDAGVLDHPTSQLQLVGLAEWGQDWLRALFPLGQDELFEALVVEAKDLAWRTLHWLLLSCRGCCEQATGHDQGK